MKRNVEKLLLVLPLIGFKLFSGEFGEGVRNTKSPKTFPLSPQPPNSNFPVQAGGSLFLPGPSFPLALSQAGSLCGLFFLLLDAWIALYLLAICVTGSCQDDQM